VQDERRKRGGLETEAVIKTANPARGSDVKQDTAAGDSDTRVTGVWYDDAWRYYSEGCLSASLEGANQIPNL
jgi:hypothetical protein